MGRKLYRSNNQKMIAGVCGGVAEYFNIDVTLIRLIVAIVGICSFGTAFLVYIIAAIIIPESPYDGHEYGGFVDDRPPADNSKLMSILGVTLVVAGIIALVSGLFPFIWRLFRKGFWPAIIIIAGLALIYSGWKNKGNN